MEWSITNVARMRQQIVSSSPKLRALESQLQACAINRDNKSAIAEKQAQQQFIKMKEKEYAELVKTFDTQEHIASSIKLAEKHTRKLENQRMLKEQIADKAASKAREEADKTLAMMSEVDEVRLMKKEKENQAKQMQEKCYTTREILARQNHLKQLRQKEEELNDEHQARLCEEAEMRLDLRRELQQAEEEAQRLRLNHRQLTLVSQLQSYQNEQEELRETRKELEALEKQEEETRIVKERQLREAEARKRFKEDLDEQIRYNKEQKVQEQDKEEEYRKLVVAVLDEEAKLDSLSREARRRRLQDHRELAEQLLEERRARRRAAATLQQHESEAAKNYHQLRAHIEEEEARQMILNRAPHLLHHLTPNLLTKLKEFS